MYDIIQNIVILVCLFFIWRFQTRIEYLEDRANWFQYNLETDTRLYWMMEQKDKQRQI